MQTQTDKVTIFHSLLSLCILWGISSFVLTWLHIVIINFNPSLLNFLDSYSSHQLTKMAPRGLISL